MSGDHWDSPGWQEAVRAYHADRQREPKHDGVRTDWRHLCLLSDGKKPRLLSVFTNVMVALRHDPVFHNAIGFDEFYQRAVLRRPLSVAASMREPQPLIDKHLADIVEWMQQAGLRQISHDNVARAVDSYAREHPFHPVRDYLDGLAWDGERRCDHWLADICGVEPTPYHNAIGHMFLISMVARIYEPGCKADYMLVIEGDQGKLKSMLCATLAEPWFSDTLPDITLSGKDASLHLRGRWLLEIPELHAFNKADATQLKSFITRPSEHYRPPYGRMEVDEPRQCLFIGTTNKDAYLLDETGGRRFWSFRALKIGIERLENSRDQLMAEAVADYRRGCASWPEPEFEAEHIQPEQRLRYDSDAWAEPIGDFLTGQTVVTLMDVATRALGFSKDRLSTADQNRIKRVLTEVGWYRAGRQGGTGITLFRSRSAQ
jgi:predicted P-loop ATPase